MNFQLAALDMAGTTVDEGGLVYDVLETTVADAAGEPVPHDLLLQWKGTSKWEAIQGLLRGLGRDPSTAQVDKIFDGFGERLVTAYRETPPEPFPGVPEMFATLRSQGVKVALQTGYSTEIAAAILDGLGWTVGAGAGTIVDAVITSDLVAASRPAPYLVFHCMEATGVQDVRRVLVAGDTPNDLGAGTNAGAGFVVGVATGSFTHDQLATEPHTHLLASTADLPTLL
ncbi:phosphonatase-like hydrolase [Nocardioides albus]|uniref:Phosphonatase-like hydrolase n=1 Tax=Nocardioides albus TaxID=1841 RepID=A0A7W5A7X9_9ACTN|nr:phosphonatase-like hydrolase [Nocardioides albus]MBB3091351.1 phosphonatase-like hydrolase [Nocardioides albus]GGU39795.1 phosphonoacetaldehyde hydrolase [Nocardioides albus]